MDDSPSPRTLIPAAAVAAILFLLVFWSFASAKTRPGKIVIPAGGTYLGPSPTDASAPQPTTAPAGNAAVSVPADAAWTARTGAVYPYSFDLPAPLSPGVFPGDPYDSVTLFLDGTDSSGNIFFRVENLDTLKKTKYKGDIKGYAESWWKDYTWKGLISSAPFTNSNGLTGYRAVYRSDTDSPSYEHVFIEVPDRPELVIWLSGRLFTKEIFDRIVDSVRWN